MKKWIRMVLMALVLTLGIVPLSHASNPISRDGYYHGIFLGGKVKVVNYGADIKVKVVNSFADLKVKPVTPSRMMSANGSLSAMEKTLPSNT